MHKNTNQPGANLYSFLTLITSLALTALACGVVVDLTAVPPPTQQAPLIVVPTDILPEVVIASPTNPPAPVVENTSAPLPTPETEDSQALADVQEYYSKGYLPFQNGQLTLLPDFSKTQPSGSDIHDFTQTKVEMQDFALWADIELNTIGETGYPNYTGCGFAYRVQNNNAGYTAILTNDYVRMGACSSGMFDCELFGTIYGDGKVDARNKTKVKFSLVVNRDQAAVLVDDLLVGKYDLFTTKLLGTGNLYYDAVSNYGAGYWSTCEMTNVKLWESRP